jgi:hypothetical protein
MNGPWLDFHTDLEFPARLRPYFRVWNTLFEDGLHGWVLVPPAKRFLIPSRRA